MEFSKGLELTIVAAPAGIDLNSSLFGSNGGNGSSDENAAELAILDTSNHPAAPHSGQKLDALTMSGMDVEGSAAGGGSFVKQRQYRKLSKEQNKELEATFEQQKFIDKRTKEALAERLKITRNQVDVWFMNRRSRLRKQQTEEIHVQLKQQVEELTRKTGRLQRKMEKLKKRKRELKKKLKEALATPQAAPPQPSPSVMLLPLPAGLNDALAAALNTQQGSVLRAPPLPPSGGGCSI
ncbi:unnamed protein product [Urochloa decumbens]|uniref:Homeobox domain-containing protein n=1 Tax=Urochloa decumbens TaxID=240449 RepID=A0ABC8W3B7_9POAL